MDVDDDGKERNGIARTLISIMPSLSHRCLMFISTHISSTHAAAFYPINHAYLYISFAGNQYSDNGSTLPEVDRQSKSSFELHCRARTNVRIGTLLSAAEQLHVATIKEGITRCIPR